MNLIHKNDLLLKLKGEVEKLKDEVRQRQTIDQATGHINQLVKLIDSNISSRQDWKVFEKNFNKVHEQFFKRLLSQYDGLTPDDMRLAAYLRMNLSSKEVAKLLNITVRGVELKRYRLRKRLNLEQEANLNEFMMAF
jgi:DNA-binding CsgD family transcriptional regulator